MPPRPIKRRKVEETPEEITFDYDARHDYLTGFHKRKLERAKHAREIAEKKARAERIEDRRKLREERKAELERHVQEVNALLRPLAAAGSESGSGDHDDSDGSEGWGGIEEAPPPIDHEAEYIDEDRYTTVTVEEMDLSKEGIYKAEQTAARAEDGNAIPDGEQEGDGETKATKRIWTKERPKDGVRKPKKKKAKFRYESKAERKQTRAKQRAKNSKQAKARREQ